ncbi:MAG TPA: type II toxin-antitoxin system prevent-host-death family antitoxin [Dissulfurispiraceae bacterium]|nr:type II toxin-antitoxin system prevent-host-death family antitoxin [Dissulfurispiraceae bacterium]
MTIVGVRELRNKLPHYLDFVRKGGQVIITDRGTPIAILRDLTGMETSANENELLACLAAVGKVRLPASTGPLKAFEGVSIKGASITETVTEERQ